MSNTLTTHELVRRVTEDHVVSDAELTGLGTRPAARNAPAALTEALAPHVDMMTPVALDRFRLFEAPRKGDPLAALRKDAVIPKPAPEWIPDDFDWDVAMDGIRNWLVQHRKPVPQGNEVVNKIVFADADLTIFNTTTPTMLRHRETGELAYNPNTNNLMILGTGPTRNAPDDIDALRDSLPDFPWDDYKFDNSEAGSLSEILRARTIPNNMAVLRAQVQVPESRTYIITARSPETSSAYLDVALKKHNVDTDGVFSVNTKSLRRSMGMEDDLFTSARRKALSMAAIIKLHGEDQVREADFLDDSDRNLQVAMQVLPRLFPNISFKFYDIVHTGDEHYERRMIARTQHGGELVDKKGRKLSQQWIETYESDDAPFPKDPDLAA